MTQEGMVRLGRLVSGAAVVLTVGAMAIVVLQGQWELAANVLAPENALIGVGFGALAWTLFPSEPRNGAIWAYAVAALSGGAFVTSVAAFTIFAPDDVLDTIIDVLPRPADLPVPAAVAAQGMVSLWLPAVFLVLTLGLLLFPNGRPPSPKWRWAVRGEIAVVVVATLGNIVLFHPWTTEQINTYHGTVGKFVELLMFPVLFGTLVSVASLVVRYRRSSAIVRRQIGWIAVGGSVYAIAQLVRYAIWGGVGDEGNSTQESFAGLTSLLGLIPLALLILSFWVAITKYRLYDLDRVISKSVTYLGLGAAITGLFALVVAVPTLVLGVSDDGQPNVVLALVATALVAVLFEPLRARLQRWANRLVYGHRSSPHEVLSQVTSRLADSGRDGGADDLARVLAQGTGATLAAVWLRNGDLIEPLGSWSADGALPVGPIRADSVVDDRTVVVPVRHGDDVLGDVSITKPRDDPPTPADRELVADVASGAGLMLRNVSLNRQLEQRATRRPRVASAPDLRPGRRTPPARTRSARRGPAAGRGPQGQARYRQDPRGARGCRASRIAGVRSGRGDTTGGRCPAGDRPRDLPTAPRSRRARGGPAGGGAHLVVSVERVGCRGRALRTPCRGDGVLLRPRGRRTIPHGRSDEGGRIGRRCRG